MFRSTFLIAALSISILLFNPSPTAAQLQAAPFEMMETVFDGDHTKAEIKRVVYRIDELYTIDKRGEEKYEAIGSVAIELAKNEPFTEMEVLQCTIVGHNDVVKKWHKMAALCATQLPNQSPN